MATSQGQIIPYKEVQKHNGFGGSHWTVIDGEVYDISNFVNQHPGGPIILLSAGRNATTLFESYHPGTSRPKVLATLKSKAKHMGRCVDIPLETGDATFFLTVRDRVETFLSKKGIKRHYTELISFAEWFSLLVAYCVCYYYGVVHQNYFAAACLGLVMTRLGFFMHMGLHSAFSQYPILNRLCGYSMDLIGSNSKVWANEHQISHHMDPNEYEKDNDCAIGDPYIRFNKWIKFKSAMHKWNHWLTVAILPLGPWRWYFADLLIIWSGVVGSVRFNTTKWDVIYVSLWKISWAIRMIYFPVLWYGWTGVIPAFICNFILALYMENIFIVNHIQSGLEPPLNKHWAVKQVCATSNWASGSYFWNWFSGGLNHQIEHHLFPSISHYNYPTIMPIVRDTCREFGLPYFNFNSWPAAWVGMFTHLKTLSYEENDPARSQPTLPEDIAAVKTKRETTNGNSKHH